MLPVIIGAAVLVGGLLFLSSSSAAPPSRPTNSVAWRAGPGGKGRIYGQPTVPINPNFWASRDVLFGCADGETVWVVEGAGYLPKIYARVRPRVTLKDGPSAWGYVQHLLDLLEIADDKDDAPRWLIQYTIDLNTETSERYGIVNNSILGCGFQGAETPFWRWRTDVQGRVREYEELPSK